MMNIQTGHVGEHLRQGRQRRRLSQLDLALVAEISARHLSFMETGRAAPSRDMLMRLAERLDIPLRERNVMLVAGGFAPAFPQRTLDDPAMKLARHALEAVLKAHEPNPALAIDRHWNLVSANRMVAPLLAGVSPKLLQGRINVMRLGLHPEGLASRTVNLHEWRGHLLERLHGQCETTADAELIALHDELKAYPVPPRSGPPAKISDSVVVPFQMRFGNDVLSFISTTMVFGTPIDVTLSELALEAFYPADEATAQKLREIAGSGG
jgi:transcriptional regulator with XRE-family HTH domain